MLFPCFFLVHFKNLVLLEKGAQVFIIHFIFKNYVYVWNFSYVPSIALLSCT